MKDRVLAYLAAFSGLKTEPWPDAEKLAAELKKELKLDDPTFRQNSQELLTRILHNYDQFSISTIDAFFQRVIRAFTRESGLLGDYRLEAEQELVMTEVVDNLIDELRENHELTDWVVRFAQENMESDKSWDIRKKLVGFSKEIFRDEYKVVEEQVYEKTSEPRFFAKFQAELLKIRNDFVTKISTPAREIREIMRQRGWGIENFKYGKGSGLITFFSTVGNVGSIKDLKIGDRLRNEFTDPRVWPNKNFPLLAKEITEVAEREFVPRLRAAVNTLETGYRDALTAEFVLENLYTFGLIADLARKLSEYKGENNLMLLAEAPKFLNKIIGESDAPFVYEKVGSFYRNYLIDEFQDTSGYQWKNFLPLLANSLDSGHPSMVVGDVKQAIYRWRGGDLSLLQQQLEENIGRHRTDVEELTSNFRSTKEIVTFNNLVFETVAKIVAVETTASLPSAVYHDVRQTAAVDGTGMVRIDFLAEDKTDKDGSWRKLALKKLVRDIEYLQEKGVMPGEIAILVRRNDEGHQVAAHLLAYKNSAEARKDVTYDVVSNDSLRIDGAGSVNLVLGALRHLVNPDDPIARAQLCYEYGRLHHANTNPSEIFTEAGKLFMESNLPEAFTEHKLSLKKLPLFELTETLIGLFNLGKVEGELAYLQAFQDIVLDFYSRERNDLASFLEWWEEFKDDEKTSIKLSGEVEAMNILTIHKSKGLQFRYVLIPFCSWYVDHEGFRAPLLWVASSEQPYQDVGPMPVRYTPKLSDSYFAEHYQEERTRALLDNLNLLYVALTRAERGMIITAPFQKSSGHKNYVAQWLFDAIQSSPDLSANYDEGAKQLLVGDIEVPTSNPRQPVKALKLESYVTSRWRDKLVIRQAGNIFFTGMNPETRERISYGVYLHAFLSRIRTTEDVTPVLDRLVQEGIMTGEERVKLENQVKDLFANAVISSWFSKDWDVRTEAPILLPGGATNRIDRLMLKDKQAVIVDFKTGEKTKADQQQVGEYIDILKQMGFTDVSGFLLYTRDREVIEVGKDMPAKVVKKKKDDKQLGLDF